MLRFSLALVLLLPGAALAQTGRVSNDGERFHAAPDGAVLAALEEGTQLRLGRRQGAWQEATLEAWIWDESVRAERNPPHDLVVSARGGENLRAAPNGRLLAYARTGMRLEEIERQGNWVHVRRTAWLRSAAVRADAPAARQAAAPERPAGDPAPARSSADAGPPPPTPAAARVGPGGGVLLTRPGADTLARLRPGAAVSLGAREGGWVRVRVEGWMPAAAVAGTAGAGDVLADVPAAALAQDPGAFNGRVLEWSVQFIALQRAEPIREDFRPGEHFILARGPTGETGFVYLAVPPELVAEVERIAPLAQLRVRARVRNAHSPLTEAPILELLEIRDIGDGGG